MEAGEGGSRRGAEVACGVGGALGGAGGTAGSSPVEVGGGRMRQGGMVEHARLRGSAREVYPMLEKDMKGVASAEGRRHRT